jgi:hypothetical protein
MLDSLLDMLMLRSSDGATYLQILIMSALLAFVAWLIYREVQEEVNSYKAKRRR